MPRGELFLDASYAIALSVVNDPNHEKALLLADELERNVTRLVTTRAVMLEIGNALSKNVFGRRLPSLCSPSKKIREWRLRN